MITPLLKMKVIIVSICLFFYSFSIVAQNTSIFWQKSDTLNTKRKNTVYIAEAAAASVALIGLNQLWYAGFERSSFHTINDNSEWLQMDKVGHVFSSYYIGKTGMNVLDWTGESKKNQLLYGATLGFVFLSTVEVLDGFSKEWGFSTIDLAANATGTGLLIGTAYTFKIFISYNYLF